MPDDPDVKKLTASRALGIKEPLKPPKQMTKMGVHLTPGGTGTPLEYTKEARDYLSQLEREKAKRFEKQVDQPAAVRKEFNKSSMAFYAKKRGKERSDDFEK